MTLTVLSKIMKIIVKSYIHSSCVSERAQAKQIL
jgi:predicted nucleic-acid-binding Zn-ribbon protein